MISPRILRRRIRSIQDTGKITKAMEMIAATKMRRAQEQALGGRPYAEKIRQVVSALSATNSGSLPANSLLRKREIKKIQIVHVTTDRGLCGGLNSNMNRLVAGFILQQRTPVSVVTVGRKGRDFMVRSGQSVRAEFNGMGDKPGILDTLPVSRIAIEDYQSGFADAVYVAYPKFVTTMVQQPVIEQLIPVETEPALASKHLDFIFEPDPAFVLNSLLPRYVEMEIYHALLETVASEQSARMVAMRSATDNAGELIDDLTVVLNKSRQETITKELLDITGGVEALAGED
jgi:F-type H+-transporting ATPase subunit gamma